MSVPLQLQMLSAEHLPLGKCETLPNGHEIVFGPQRSLPLRCLSFLAAYRCAT